MRADATRFRRRFDAWNRYGVSALLARNDVEVASLSQTRLERFPIVIVYARQDLAALDVEIVPTFRTPHVTLAQRDLDALVRALLTCEHRSVRNPSFDE